ncbi:MAG: hypothetical protein OEY93_09180 [Anaerolineae bacterium]|nr:hypothetical protein [Anaerolineae bacterium]
MKRILPLLIILMLLVPNGTWASPQDSVTIPNGGPTFWVDNVVRDESVTIKVKNFPKGKTYDVYIGRIGTNFDNDHRVGGLGGVKNGFTKTFDIPSKFRGYNNLALQIVNPMDGSYGYLIFSNYDGFDSGDFVTLEPIHHSSAQSVGGSVGIFNGPDFWVQDVIYPKFVTLRFRHYDGKSNYKVFIGENNPNFRNYYLGMIDNNQPNEFTVQYSIPESLWDEPLLMIKVVDTQLDHSGSVAFTNQTNWNNATPWGYYTTTIVNMIAKNKAAWNQGTPYTNVINVVKDGEVTLQVFNMPPDKDLTVTMGPQGSKGINGIVIGNQTTGEGGNFVVTYAIPAQLYGSNFIAIRLQSTTSSHFAYDLFQNEDGYSSAAGAVAFNGNWVLPAGTYPSTIINSVDPTVSVTVSGFNFTKNDFYTVKMGPLGSQGVGGFVVGTQYIDGTGTFTATYTIPAALVGLSEIAIRFESQNSVYYAYDWFWNIP